MFLLTSMICTSSVIPAFAAEGTDGKADPVIYQTITDKSESKTAVTEVKASIKSTYEVMLPKTMSVINGDNAYTVNVKGDLAGDEAIAVTPDATVSLSSEGKNAVIGNITQEKQTFTYADASKKTDDVLTGTDASGNISINGLTAGHWTGTFNFNVGTNKYVPMSANLNADKSTAKLEETVNLTANATDGKAPYQYQFKMRAKGTEDWTNLTDYGASNTYTWIVDKTGTYELAVDIKDASNTVVTKTTDITTETNIGEDVALTKDNLSTYGITNTGDVVIPSAVTDSAGMKHKVTSIGTDAFLNSTDLTSIKIPDSVTKIGDRAFKACEKLESINIPNGITSIGYMTFCNCASLKKIEIPDSVTMIGSNAFQNCTSLTSITLGDNLNYIGPDAFDGCSRLISIKIPKNVTNIDSCAFTKCTSLREITLPDNITKINWGAFEKCPALQSVTYKGTTYTNKTALENALKANNVSVGSDVFLGTALQ